MPATNVRKLIAFAAARGGIFLGLVVALEVAIMISPFAFFFYSVFNPVLHWFDQYAITRWLTAFFLPHMILPPTPLLAAIRVLGSGLFIVGLALFVSCAAQVYLGKLLRWGMATKGLYHYVRHPQYSALILWSIGMAILWPRFLVLATFSIMCLLYYFLALDEETRMLSRYDETYRRYQQSTGMFLPLFVEKRLGSVTNWLARWVPTTVTIPIFTVALVIAVGFLCRTVTLDSLRLVSQDNITLLSILPEDQPLAGRVLTVLIRHHRAGAGDGLKDDHDYLAYLMPTDYIMQGMIADTGGQSHLYHHHQTLPMITEWVLHPFAHLRAHAPVQMTACPHAGTSMAMGHSCPMEAGNTDALGATFPNRRVILVEIEHSGATHVSGKHLFAFNSVRVPVVVVDLNATTGEILNITKVGPATAWGDVPTPAF